MSGSQIKEKRISFEISKFCKQLLILLNNSYDPKTSELQITKRIVELLHSLKSVGSLKSELNKVLKEIIRQRLKTCLYKDQRTTVYTAFLDLILTERELWTTLVENKGLTVISKLLSEATRPSNTDLPTDYTRSILLHLTGLFKHYDDDDDDVGDLLNEMEEHEDIIISLVVLLNTKDHEILGNSLQVLLMFSRRQNLCKIISHLNSVEILITIVESYDLSYKRSACELLSELLNENEPKQMVKICEGVPIFLRQLTECDVKTAQCIVQCLCKLSCDQELANEIKVNKGLEILLSLLHNDKFHPKNQITQVEKTSDDQLWIQYLHLKSMICECISELGCYDNISFEVVQINAVFFISLLILPPCCHQHKGQGKSPLESSQSEASSQDIVQSWLCGSTEYELMNDVDLDNLGLNDVPIDNEIIILAYKKMQIKALKALRIIFSMERNRGKFKKLFTPNLFEKFIDVGHHNRRDDRYEGIVKDINKLDEKSLQQLKSNVENTNNNKIPMKVISDYAVIDVLGAGAFGTVYKVQKLSQPQTYFAMKEVYDSSISMTTGDGLNEIKELHTELNILRENLCHQNIVQYHMSFIFDKRLYIVMEFIDGATLYEHLESTKQKRDRLTEERVWNIFVQLVQGLRYLHKEKRIVHRDLKPNNVMLGGNDRVILTDFGLAKQKNPENSKMMSVVGSIQYSSPELVQNEEYGEKVDIWSLGCLLYHMCQLTPPFMGSNMLALVAKIVESRYKPIDKDQYSTLISTTIDLCLTSDQKIRPDINGVASSIGTILLSHLDEARKEEVNLKKKLDSEKLKSSYNQFYDNDTYVTSRSHDSGYLSNKLSPKLISWGMNQSKETSSSNQLHQRKAWGSPSLRARSSENKTLKHLSANQIPHKTELPKLFPLKPTSLPPFHPKTCSKRAENSAIFIPQGVNRLAPSYEENENFVVTPIQSGHALFNRRLSRSSINTNHATNYSILPELNLKQGSKVSLLKMRSAPNIRSKERVMTREVRKMIRASSSRSLLSGGSWGDAPIRFFDQLHKIIYITQSPPCLQYCPKRKIVEDFKKQLFQSSQTINMSLMHIQKLMEGSHDVVDMKISPLVMKDLKIFQKRQVSGDWLGDGLTYFYLSGIIDQLLTENNYY